MIKLVFLLLCVSYANCFYYSDSSETTEKEKIVGGITIDIKRAPHLVQIIENGTQVCGGSIIGKYWILSAAHCFEEVTGRISVITGSSNAGSGMKHKVESIRVYKKYNKDTVDNDIALLELRHAIPLDESRKIIPITDTLPKTGDKLRIAGFGKTGETADFSDDLKGAVVKVIDHRECERMYASDNVDITDNMFCAAKKGKDSCKGDSGGPAVINGKLAGITSFALRCADARYPGVYTQIYKYRDWIASKTGLQL